MPEALTPDPVMNLVYQSFARNLSMALSAHLRFDIGMALDPGLLPDVPLSNPACLAVFRIEPGNVPLVVDFPLPFAKLIIELILGGQPTPFSDEPVTGLTEIEKHLLVEILDMFAVELAGSMARLGNFQVRSERVETEIEMLRAFAPGERLLRLGLKATAGEEDFMIKISQPVLAGSPRAGEDAQNDSASPDTAFLDLLAMVEVDFEARLQGPRVALRELMSLAPGDVIRLRHQVTQPLAGYINGESQFKGQIVNANRRRAFLVEPSA